MNRSKVLVCASNARHLEHFHLPYLQVFRESGWTVHTAAQGALLSASADKKYDLAFQKRLLSFQNLFTILRLAGILKRERYGLICVHTTLAAAICRIALLLSGLRDTKLVYTCHGYFFGADESGKISKDLRSLFYLMCERLLAPKTDLLLLMNRNDYASARRYRLCKKTEFINGMGLDPARYGRTDSRQRTRLRQTWNADEDTVVFLCVGEFSRRKNQAQILAAFSRLAAKNRNVRLVFAGNGALEQDCKACVNTVGLDGLVFFSGYAENIAPFYAAADVLVTASRSEGLPFNVLEALYFHLPVIASQIKGHTDLISHGENGLLFPTDDADQLTENMLRIADSRILLAGLREHAALEAKFLLKGARPRFFAALETALGQPVVAGPLYAETRGAPQ